jgi:polysaccharide export outer membrane protein
VKPLLLLLAGLAGLRAAADVGTPANPATVPSHPKFVYTLTVGDKVHIEVIGQDDCQTVQTIDAQGSVNLAYIGQTHLAGLTKDQAQQAIADAYVQQQYLKNPQVRISMEDYAPREVAISGQVKNPGRYTLPPEGTLSVVELVTKAGGFTDIANGANVEVSHAGNDASGKKSQIRINVQDILKGKGKVSPDDPSLLLQPGDLVYVPESLI